MIAVTVTLLGFAIADLVIWTVEVPTIQRAVLATMFAAVACGGLAALAGYAAVTSIIVLGLGSFAFIGLWLWLSRANSQSPLPPLLFMVFLVASAFALSGSFAASAGPLATWYADLPFPFVSRVPLDQFLLGAAATLFVLATANQVVRLVLEAAGTPPAQGETALRGGRMIGVMERLFVLAMVVFGALVAVAALVAAKGLVRLPEIRTKGQQQSGEADEVTEYFLIGTLVSLLVAVLLGGIVLGAG